MHHKFLSHKGNRITLYGLGIMMKRIEVIHSKVALCMGLIDLKQARAEDVFGYIIKIINLCDLLKLNSKIN